MNREDIIRVAREAEIDGVIQTTSGRSVALDMHKIERFAALVAAVEREACAKVCDDLHHQWRWDDEPDSSSGPRDCAAAIRARGQA